MKNTNRKAFTLVELVIVIAVIAILAGVMIPTFGAIIKNAHISNDTSTAASINIAIASKIDGINSIDDLNDAIDIAFGTDYHKVIEPKSAKHGYHFWYNIETNSVEVKPYDPTDPDFQNAEDGEQAYFGNQADGVSAIADGISSDVSFDTKGRDYRLLGKYFLLDNAGTIGKVLYELDKGINASVPNLSAIGDKDDNFGLAQALIKRLGYVAEVTSFEINATTSGVKDIGSIVYIPYDVRNLTLKAEHFTSNTGVDPTNATVNWISSDEDLATITPDGNTCDVTVSLPEAGGDDVVTITATVTSGGKSITKDVTILYLYSATLGDNNTDFGAIDLDNSGDIPEIEISYDGTKTEFTLGDITAIGPNYSVDGVNFDTTVTISTDIDEIFTIEGNVLKLTTTQFGEQTFTVKVGEYLETQVKVTVKDNSGTPFTVNYITDDVKMGDSYLFRVGNANKFVLSELFNSTNPGDKIKLTIYDGSATDDEGNYYEIYTADGENVKLWASYTSQLTSETWANSTIQFHGTGVAIIKVETPKGDAELKVEVVDGYNVTKYSELKSTENNVLLNDITLSSGSFYVSSNKYLWGNGFTFDVKNGSNTEMGIITLNRGATLDNVKVVGPVYNEYQGKHTQPYSASTVLANENSRVVNCYISNGRAPLRTSGDVLVENTTLHGGRYANMDIRSGNVTLKNVTTINQSNLNDKTASGEIVIGLGIVVYIDAPTDTTVTIAGELHQYNFISEDDEDYIPSDLASSFNVVFAFNQFKHNNKYVNTGILFMNGKSDMLKNQPNTYSQDSKSLTIAGITRTGFIYSLNNTLYTFIDQALVWSGWTPNAQYSIDPIYSFNHTINAKPVEGNDYAEIRDDGVFYISMDQGDVFEFNTNILTVKKYGIDLSYAVYLDGVLQGDVIEFTKAGSYELVFEYEDRYNYDKTLNKTDKVYTKTYHINVSVVIPNAKPAEFVFSGSNGTIIKQPDGKGYYYVSLDVNAAVSGSIGKKTVDGIDVYYPIVEAYNGSDFKWDSGHNGAETWHASFPVFRNVITITDYANGGLGDAIVYNDSNTSWPTFADGTKKLQVENPQTTFVYSGTSSNVPKEPAREYSGVWAYKGENLTSNDRTEQTIVAQYQYSDNAGNTYYYYVGYHCPKHTGESSCVTGDTLITLADGSQVRVDSLTGNEMLLVWDHVKGELSVAPIAYIVNHDETISKHNVMSLVFSDGSNVDIIGEHVFFDKTLNKYVAITADNVNEFIGHVFVSNVGDGLSEITLVAAIEEERNTGVYEVVTYQSITCFTNGVLSASAYLDPILNVFDIDEDTLAYDLELMMADIEKYGLYTYEDFEGLVPVEAFEMYNAAYLKVAVGKGYITWNDILDLIDIYYNNDITPIQ